MAEIQAVIMAGGKGTRLASITKDIPKPMVPIMGKPLLEHQIERLKENGISDILLVVGHLGDVIRAYFQDGSNLGVNISYFVEEEPLGTAGALKLIKEQLKKDFVLLFGDLYLDVDFCRFMNFHKEKNSMVTLFAHPNSHPYDSDILVADENGCVTEWSYKNSVRTKDYRNLVNAGVYVINRDAIASLPEEKKVDLEKQLITKLIPDGVIYAYHSTEYVKDVGTPERLMKVEQDVKNGITKSRNLKKKQKVIFLDRDGTLNKHIGFLKSPEELVLEEHAAEAVQKINESEYLAIVITNQPVVARGECSFDTLNAIHNRLHTLLGEKGAYIDGLYFCPHHPDKGFAGEVPELKIECDCRKPSIGMIRRAVEDYNIDLENSWMIGDTGMDVQTGINAGVKTALVMTGEKEKFKKYSVRPDVTGKDLLNCVEQILGRKRTC